jgi:hypothetical protein
MTINVNLKTSKMREITRQTLTKSLFSCLFLGITMAYMMHIKPQNPIKWSYIEDRKGETHRLIQNKNGAFVSVGTARSERSKKDTDVFFSIVDSTGKPVVKTKTIGDSNTEGANSLVQTQDGNYVIAGFKDNSAWLIKVDSLGSLIWEKTMGSSKGLFTDIVEEEENGALWLTGATNGQLWVVSVDSAGKFMAEYTFKEQANPRATTCGNGITWSDYEESLVILGTEYSEKKPSLLIVKFDTEDRRFLDKPSRYEQAEGKGMVRDNLGNFGIIGTSYRRTYSDILFAYYDTDANLIKKDTILGLKDHDDKGFGIAKDTSGQFILVGVFFEKDRDRLPQPWVHKIAVNGRSNEDTPLVLAKNYNNVLQSILVSTNGHWIAAGNSGEKPWLVALIPPSVSTQKNVNNLPEKQTEVAQTSDTQRPTKVEWDMRYEIEGNDTVVVAGSRNFELKFMVKSSQKKIADANVKIWMNGETYTNGDKGDNVKLDSSSLKDGYYYQFFTRNIFLKEASAKIQVEVSDATQSMRSNKLKVKLKLPNLYVLAVGVPYKLGGDVTNQLKFTRHDANSIVKVFLTQKRYFERVKIKRLTSPEATKAGTMRQQINQFFEENKPTDADIVVFFASGHGSINQKGRFMIWGSDFDSKDSTTYLDYEKDVGDLFDKEIKGKRFVFIDACQNLCAACKGEDTESGSYYLSSIVASKPAYRPLFSCQKGEHSVEADSLQHGVFTYALLEALKKKKPFVTNSGALAFDDICKYTSKRVPELAKKYKDREQHPIYTTKQSEKDGYNSTFFIF